MKKKSGLYYLFTAVGVIMFWRGLWGTLDLYLFPGMPWASYVSSFVIGLAILYFNDRHLNDIT